MNANTSAPAELRSPVRRPFTRAKLLTELDFPARTPSMRSGIELMVRLAAGPTTSYVEASELLAVVHYVSGVDRIIRSFGVRVLRPSFTDRLVQAWRALWT